MLVPVYDIANCGPRRRFAANGKLVHNSDNINLQNLPRESMLKKAIQAPEGYVLIDCDSSQIEARVLAWMSGQEDLVRLFEQNNKEIAAGVQKRDMQFDPYRIMAANIYNLAEVGDVDNAQRQVGKVVLLGAGYGLGWKKFKLYAKQQNIDVDDDFAERTIRVYRETFPMIPRVWGEGDTALEAIASNRTTGLGRSGVLFVDGRGIRLPNGLFLTYPNLRQELDPKTGYPRMVYDTKKGRAVIPKSIWGGSVTENVCQALARIIIAGQMLKIAERYRVAMTVHDSVVAVVPQASADEARAYVEECMRTPPPWAKGLPLNCESKMGETYGG